jgi:cellulose synthase/poly-beta-1,6-N-acetylglucosamine synthase-like glycosyltransferase
MDELRLALQIVLFGSLATVAYAYFGYPILIWLASRIFGRESRRPEGADTDLPSVTLLIAAYNEETEIAKRIENALEADYPADKYEIVVASDGSSDRTNEIARSYERFGVKLLAFPVRRGKATVLNDAIPAASGEIVMLSDANTFTHAAAAQRLAGWFCDPKVGVVCGRLVLTDSATGKNVDSLYWKYETFLKKCEGRLGALLGANGAIYAIRKSLFQGIPGNTIVDDFVIPLLAHKRSGCRIVYDKEAVAVEETPAKLKSEFHRRTRIGAGGFQSIGMLFGLLSPLQGWTSFTFASHKILRWLCPFALLAALVANAFLASQPEYFALLCSQLLFYGVSLVAARLPTQPRVLRYPRVATMFTMMNAALLVGFFRWLRSSQSAAWKRTERVLESSHANSPKTEAPAVSR